MKTDLKKFDAIIVGAGFAGLWTAFSLAKKNKKVLVVDTKTKLSGTASDHSAGILDPFAGAKLNKKLLPLLIESEKNYGRLIKSLERSSKVNTQYRKSGLLQIAKTQREYQILRKEYGFVEKHFKAYGGSWVDGEEASKIEPLVKKEVFGGFYLSSLFQICPKHTLRALRLYLRRKKVLFVRASNGKFDLLEKGSEVIGIRVGRRAFHSSAVLLATGSWMNESKTGLKSKIQPVKGQIALYHLKSPIQTMVHDIFGNYLIPWQNKVCLAGATLEDVGFKKGLTKKGRQKFTGSLSKLIPNLKTLSPKKEWYGFRPSYKNALPIIGEARKNLYIAGGYYRYGILLSPYAGELLADMMMGGKGHASLRPFSPKRWRKV